MDIVKLCWPYLLVSAAMMIPMLFGIRGFKW